MSDAQQFAARLAHRQRLWPLLEGWPEAWCQSFGKQTGYFEFELDKVEQELGNKLPVSLREAYRFAGRRLAKYNHPLVEPHRVFIVQNLLVFWAENQYVETWGVHTKDLKEEDPPVYVDLNGCDSELGKPSQLVWQNAKVSEFIFQMVLWDYMEWAPAPAVARLRRG
ncbi:MAG: hypothetical protein JO250_17025 [Armatimonadetes bacterium]|nr:hypothetical protein [Armatimonadota bacterium]